MGKQKASSKKSSTSKTPTKTKQISKKEDSATKSSPVKSVSKSPSKASPRKSPKKSPSKSSILQSLALGSPKKSVSWNENDFPMIKKKASYISDPNFPVFPDGSTYHLELKPGMVANRIITCGDHGRGRRLLSLLDADTIVKTKEAARKFSIYTGTFNGTPLSIIVSLMGSPNVDFVIRETRYVINGPMAIIRLGSCGLIDEKEKVGTTIVGKGSCFVQTTFAKELGLKDTNQYRIVGPVAPSIQLSDDLFINVSKALDKEPEQAIQGLIMNSDSFYSSQGRIDKGFNDENENLIEQILEEKPDAKCFEMESFTIFALAHRSKTPIYTGALCISLAKRNSDDCIMEDRKHILEKICGKGVMKTLAEFKFPGGEPDYTDLVKNDLQKK